MNGTVRRRVRVRGRVQGVFFRASTSQEAARLGGLKGWVRNDTDGSVEVLVEGPREKVDNLIKWLRQGPPLAKVAAVEARDEEPGGDLPPFEVEL
jgi:acylphosphatase